jgi:hypothetical protein
MKPRPMTEKQRRDHVETLALLARVVVLSRRRDVRHLFFVLSVS